MPTIFSHVAVPLAAGLGLGLGRRRIAPRLLAAGLLASILPDFDVLPRWFGYYFDAPYGHRGFTHSLAFALAVGLLAGCCARSLHTRARTAFLFVTAATLSHPLLDMLTTGGYGVALWWPFSDVRVSAPWNFIEVSPIRLERFFSARGGEVMLSELRWIWLPAAGFVASCWLLRRRLNKERKEQ